MSYSVGTMVISVGGGGVKLPAREIDHLLTSSADVKNEWSCTSASPVCLHGMDRGGKNYTVTFKIINMVLQDMAQCSLMFSG